MRSISEMGKSSMLLNNWKKQWIGVFLGCLCWLASHAQDDRDNPSLRELFVKEGVPIFHASESDLDKRISSGDAIESSIGRILVYYAIPRDGKTLGNSFYVFRKDKSGWLGGKMNWPGTSNDGRFACQGGSISVAVQGGYVLIHGHLTPSAGCTLVLDQQLAPIRSFDNIGTTFVGGENFAVTGANIHFAPVHPLKIWILNMETGEKESVYPVANESKDRKMFRETIKALYDACESDSAAIGGCRQRLLDADLNNDGDTPSEDSYGIYAAPELAAFMVDVRVFDDTSRAFFADNKNVFPMSAGAGYNTSNLPKPPRHEWKTPHFMVIYRNTAGLSSRNSRIAGWQAKAIDANEFILRFGDAASRRAPDAAMLQAIWPD